MKQLERGSLPSLVKTGLVSGDLFEGGERTTRRCVILPVMAGLVPAIHVFAVFNAAKTWMPGTRPGMTSEATKA